MWAAQMDDLRDAYRVIAIDLPGHGRLADRAASPSRARPTSVADAIETARRRPRGRRRPVAGWLRRDGPGGSSTRSSSAAWSCPARPPNPWARSLRRIGPSPGSWIGSTGRRLDALNAWFFRTRFPPAIAEPIVAGGFWSAAGAQALRAIVGERFQPRLAAYPGPTLILNGEWDAALPAVGAGAFARAAQDARGGCGWRGATHLANLDRPGAFNLAVRRFVESLPPLDQATGEPVPTGAKRVRC